MIIKILTSHKFIVPVVTIIVSFIVITIVNKSVKRILVKNASSIKTKKRNTVTTLVGNIIKYLIIIIAVIIILSDLGIDVSAIVTSLGVAGVVGGLALQDALKDIIAGSNIIADNYFVVGDLVKFDDFTGIVTDFGLKKTTIKGYDGTVLIVANREISKIYNLSMSTVNLYIKIPVAYEESEENVASVLKNICKKITNFKESCDESQYLGIDELGDSSVNYMISASCKPGNQYSLKRKILAIVKNEFDKNNIKIPYPQIEVHDGK